MLLGKVTGISPTLPSSCAEQGNAALIFVSVSLEGILDESALNSFCCIGEKKAEETVGEEKGTYFILVLNCSSETIAPTPFS